MEFKCINPECEDFDKIEFISKVSYKYDSESKSYVSSQQLCLKCKQMRVNLSSDMPLSEKQIGVLKIPSMTKPEKTAMLKKRSHEHYKKNIEESAKDKLGRAMKEMRGKRNV